MRIIHFLFTVSLAVLPFQFLNAQTDVPQPPPDVNGVDDRTGDSLALAQTARPEPGSTRRGNNPVLFLVGNSTMRNGTLGNGNNGQWGWGAFFQPFFNPDRITVENQALGGMSSRTFYKRLWAPIRDAIRPGDWVIISIGHNDNGPYDSGRARASIPGIGNDSLIVTIQETGEVDTVYTYGGYMRRYINDVRRAGGHPILMSLTPRNAYDDHGHVIRKQHSEWLRQVGEEEGVPFIDQNEISGQKIDSYSEWKKKFIFHGDNIHTSKLGAEMNARSAAEGIAYSADPRLKPLQEMMNDVTPPMVDVKREDGKPVVFITGDSTVKNADKEEDGMWGWGSQAYTIFDERKITIANCAMAGRSCRTFMNEGRWDKVYNSIHPGDFVLIQFGHNDFGELEKPKYRGEIFSAQDTCHVYQLKEKGTYELVYSFGWYLKKFIDDVREKGGTPILVSLTPRNEWENGKIERRNDTYGRFYREVVEATGVEFVDMHNITADYLDRKCGSKEKASSYYKRDHTHTSLKGARLNAKSMKKGLKKIHSPLAKFLK